MAQSGSIKQVGGRVMGCTVQCMEWSNKMDLIAFGNEKGEVIIQRLNFQRIVTFPAPAEGVMVRTLSWQLNETMLAAGYNNGQVRFLDVERETVVFSIDFSEDIEKLHFSNNVEVPDYLCPLPNDKQFSHVDFLPALPALNGLSTNLRESEAQKSFTKCAPCFLIVTLFSGQVHMLLYGALRAGSIDLKQHVSHPDEFKVFNTCLSGDYSTLLILLRDGQELKVLKFSNEILKEYMSPLMQLAENCANIYETKHYINETIQCILESWETVVLEMDNKLTKYCSAQQPEGSISADFLDILLFGYTQRTIMNFLMDELTEKGVKKLASAVELGFCNIQYLLSKSLQCAATNMFYFLNTIKGMALFEFFFDQLLDEEAAADAQRLCGAFILKAQELYQVIERCSHDMRLFFTWLQVVIVRFHMQDLPEELNQLSEQDYRYLAEYLYNFEDCVAKNDDGSVTKRKFNIEKIGQYFENKNLTHKSKRHPDKLWHRLLQENECLRNCNLIYKNETEFSLVQQSQKLFDGIETVLRRSGENINAHFTLQTQILCGNTNHTVQSCFKCADNKGDLLALTLNDSEIMLLEFAANSNELTCTRLSLLGAPSSLEVNLSNLAHFEQLRFVDLQFYNAKTLSILVEGVNKCSDSNHQSSFVQFHFDKAPLRSIRQSLQAYIKLDDSCAATNNIHSLLGSGVALAKAVDGVCSELSVSGSRKVASLLCDNRKRMLIYEMEVDEEDDDTVDTTQNSILEMSKEFNASNSHEHSDVE